MTSPGSLTFVGTATTLIRSGGITVLSDPNFLHRGQRACLGKGLWSRRLTAPALQLHELPPLDAVVLSHLHGDPFDRVAKKGLDRDLPIHTTRASARTLRRRGFPHAVALDTWSTHTLTEGETTLTLTGTPGQHSFGPGRASCLPSWAAS